MGTCGNDPTTTRSHDVAEATAQITCHRGSDTDAPCPATTRMRHAQRRSTTTSTAAAAPAASRQPRSPELFDRPCPLARAMHRRQAPFVVFFTYTCFLRVSYYATSGRDIGRSHSRLIPTGAGSCDQWSRVALPSRRTSREGSELGRGACCESAARPRACAASCSGGARALKALWSWR